MAGLTGAADELTATGRRVHESARRAVDDAAAAGALSLRAARPGYSAGYVARIAGTARATGSRAPSKRGRATASVRVGGAVRFSGGATARLLVWGAEYGSSRHRQFPSRRPAGWFLTPALDADEAGVWAELDDAFTAALDGR